jgi:cytidylate kinase
MSRLFRIAIDGPGASGKSNSKQQMYKQKKTPIILSIS